jgi:hypothetical protein
MVQVAPVDRESYGILVQAVNHAGYFACIAQLLGVDLASSISFFRRQSNLFHF